MDEPMGPETLEGWARCHGCEARIIKGGLDAHGEGEHLPDCPGLCVRPRCDFHPKV